MSHIFISYSKKNKQYAYALADHLQECGFNVWIDRIGIEYGVDWWDAIVEGLRQAGAFIVVMTPESKASAWVKREVFIALEWRTPMFPILLNGDNWELFVLTQYADLRSGALPDADFISRLGEHVTPRDKGINLWKKPEQPQPHEQPTPPPESAFDVDQAIADFGAAFRQKRWSDALNVLGRIRASGQDPTPFDPDAFERSVQASVEAENRQREQAAFEAERARQYRRLRAAVELGDDQAARAAIERFAITFPDYDPDNLRSRFQPPPPRASRQSSLELLPQPFAWIPIPAGRVTLVTEKGWAANYIPEGKSQTFDVAAFSIAKYPVTNAQFRLFWQAQGYQERRWWTDAGWKQCEKEGWTEPRYWTDSRWNGDEQPVVGVSWYEAVAFCQWLSEVTGDSIRLPTEQQWQRAAQGDDGRDYPWGPQWDGSRCNNDVDGKGIGRTTPVRQYEGKDKGDSPFGVVDMAGNVWEWCLTAYATGSTSLDGTDVRILRGGSWGLNITDNFRCGYRNWSNPHSRSYFRGFRLALS